MMIHHRTRRFQHLAVRAMGVACVLCGLARQAAAEDKSPSVVRVRSTDVSLAALIDRAAAKSATFQRLVAAIQRSNGMVQIEAGACGAGVPACLLMWMETASSNRFLRILINRRYGLSDVDVMASLGHELQHAVEALSESGVTNSVLLYNFFGRLAPNGNGSARARFETAAAIYAGNAVREELRLR